MFRKKFYLGIIGICIILFVQYQNVFGEEKIKIAVIDLEPRGVSTMTSSVISDFLRIDLFDTKKFIVVERNQMENILKEQTFQRTGCTTTECVIEVGKILNVEQMLVGSVSKLKDTYYINVRVVDVATGEVKLSKEVSCKEEDELRNASRKLIIKLIGVALEYEEMGKGIDKKDVTLNKYKMEKKLPELKVETLKRDDMSLITIEKLYIGYDELIDSGKIRATWGVVCVLTSIGLFGMLTSNHQKKVNTMIPIILVSGNLRRTIKKNMIGK
ncbi:MAG: CsgG/HfaB family protein [Candidatus Firestonebacteria bacterium]